MNADYETKEIMEVVESEFKDLLGPELFAVYHSYITSFADFFAHTVKCAYGNGEETTSPTHEGSCR